MLALFGFAELLVPFLLTLGTAIPPLGGVILADFFVCRRGEYPELEKPDAFVGSGFLAYGIGVAAAWFLPGVPPVTGIVVGFLVQAVLGRG